MIELFSEYPGYMPATLLLLCGVRLTASTELEIRFAGLFLALVGAMSLPITSAAVAVGGAITIAFFYLTI